MRAIRKVMFIDLATTVLVFAGSIVGAEINGALGALWAITFVQASVAVVMWATFLAHTLRPEPTAALTGEPLPATVTTPPAA
jgi:hypothetical protein